MTEKPLTAAEWFAYPETQRHHGEVYVPLELWGRDHWSLLRLVGAETAKTNTGAYTPTLRTTELLKFRCNPKAHPFYLGQRRDPPGFEWNYGTRLSEKLPDGTFKIVDVLTGHDDWHCIEDMEAWEVLILDGTGLNPVIRLAPRGKALLDALQEFARSSDQANSFNFRVPPGMLGGD